MPEYVEIRMEADRINKSKGKKYKFVRNHPGHRSGDIQVPLDEFTLEAESRGKELKITFKDVNTNQTISYMFGMGMSGGFAYGPADDPHPKNARVTIYGSGANNTNLYLVDRRNFAFWKLGTWKEDRSPDILREGVDWWNKIKTNINKKLFNKPIYEVMMDQRYFNGIGNYLRAEILGRIDSNPFVSARDYIAKNEPELIKVTSTFIAKTLNYKKQMGLNYNNKEPYLKFYKKGNSIEDKGKRTFWYNPKWESNVKEMLKS